MYKIEDAIPIPKGLRKRGPSKYPWLELKVGQSFLVPLGNINNLRSVASNAGKKYNRKFTAREIKSEQGVRVWRVK
jgi:hypothetical protein